MNEFVENFNNKTDLKNKIVDLYVLSAKAQIEFNKSILSDKNWASDGSDYHNNCRSELINQNKNLNIQLTTLKKTK